MPPLRICEELRLFMRKTFVTEMQSANLSNLHDPAHRCGSSEWVWHWEQ
jgi:hypothetical protein